MTGGWEDLGAGLKIGSLFSGIGGLELGLERAGVGHTVWQVEKDEFCRRVLAKHWPDTVRYEDVTTVDWASVEPVEVLCGGFPCPPVSQAGLRLGMLDERWLWPEFARAIRDLRPRYVVVENVAALLHDADAFGSVLGDLAAFGFDADWSVVPACAVGAPHTRDRVFLLAYPAGADAPSEVPPQPFDEERRAEPGGSGGRPGWSEWWLSEPDVDRMADGVPRRVVRGPLHAFGNAVVPQVSEVVGHLLLELEAS
jgi:DNA (cytosine-5)-methyltransferase 1